MALFDAGLAPILTAAAEGIGTTGAVSVAGQTLEPAPDTHALALTRLLAVLKERGWPLQRTGAAAHRVVHGGSTLVAPQRITARIREEIEANTPLAPLHNPHHLFAIDALAERAPDLPQFASFDTAFHATMPGVARDYALPRDPRLEDLRRYGFHGLSYAALVRTLRARNRAALPSRLLALHLGNGASACAIRDGRSVATTMGYGPTGGLTMGTRVGDIDPDAVLSLVDRMGAAEVRTLLTQAAGLAALSGGSSDMRALLDTPDAAAAHAVAHFCYWAARHAGSLVAAMGGCDAIAFTGGMGAGSAVIRARILSHLDWLGVAVDPAANAAGETRFEQPQSQIHLYRFPAEEEREIAHEARALLLAGS